MGAGINGLYVGELESGERKQLMTWESMLDNTMARYAAGHLFYTRNRSLLARPFDVAQLEFRGAPVRIADDVAVWGPGYVSFAVSDRVLVYRETAYLISQLTWVNADGAAAGTLGPPGAYGEFSLSPDQRRVVVSRLNLENRREPAGLWVVDSASGLSTSISSGGWTNHPVWSPDLQKVAYATGIDSPPNPYVRNANGTGEPERLFASADQSYPPHA